MTASRRVAFSMTIDPDGAMHDWVDLPEGWALTRIPTQEAVHLLGIRGYQEVLEDVCARERPDIVVTHPPYDYLDIAVADRLRAAGTRLVAYAFDDEIFAHHYGPETRAALARIYDRYVTTREVPWATAPLPALAASEGAPKYDVALVGRAYARRLELVEALRAAGFTVATRGLGWPEGFISRPGMIALYAEAAVVLTTADWESHAVPMVKHRLLDTAMLGAFQIAQDAPDLRVYFDEYEVPSYRDIDELIAKLRAALADPGERRARAAAARKRALGEHTWRHRFPELIKDLPLHSSPVSQWHRGSSEPRRYFDTPPLRGDRGDRGDREGEGLRDVVNGPGSTILDHLYLSLATRAESDGRVAAAAALYRELLSRVSSQPTALAGLGRCLRDLGQLDEAIAHLRRAAAAPAPVAAAALHAGVPPYGVGCGLGRLGLWPPAAEPTIFLIAALVERGDVDSAMSILDDLDNPGNLDNPANRDNPSNRDNPANRDTTADIALRRALAATLRFDDENPAYEPLRRRLDSWRAADR